MDQAASLRELMNKMQVGMKENEETTKIEKKKNSVEKAASIAVISTENSYGVDEMLKRLAVYSAEKRDKKIGILGIEKEKTKELYSCLEKKRLSFFVKQIDEKVKYIPGSLEILNSIRANKDKVSEFINELEVLENEMDCLFYYAGGEIKNTTINLTLSSNKVIFVLKPTSSSFKEFESYLKVFQRISADMQIGVIFDTNKKETFQKNYKKIQELSWSQFKYYIEPIGYVDLKFISMFDEKEVFERFNTTFLFEETKEKKLSETLLKIMQ